MKKLTVIHKYIFLALLILPSILWGVKGAFHLDIWEYEMGENRYLAEMPEGFSAEYPAEPVLGFFLQRHRHTAGGGSVRSHHRLGA